MLKGKSECNSALSKTLKNKPFIVTDCVCARCVNVSCISLCVYVHIVCVISICLCGCICAVHIVTDCVCECCVYVCVICCI